MSKARSDDSATQAEALIAEAARTAATRLSLVGMNLTALPESVGQLVNLQSLYLASNQLTALPESVGQLVNLQFLNLVSNQLIKLPESVGQLVNLQILNLERNRLTVLPESVGQLANLQVLNLASNQLTALPESVGQLANLQSVDLTSNKLTVLPESLSSLDTLKSVFIHSNDALQIPSEVLGSTAEEVLRGRERANPKTIFQYYFRTLRETTHPLSEVKILLVGQGGVGKTSLVNQFIRKSFAAGEPKTHGIQIVKSYIPGWGTLRPSEESIQLNIWDFGGQEIMHATHQFFLSRRSLYLLVLDARQGELEGNLRYWLKIIQIFGGDSPILVVINKIDEHAFDINARRLQIDYAPNLKGFHRVSCKTGQGIEALRTAIDEQVRGLPHLRDRIPDSFQAVRNQLEAESSRKDFVDFREYESICKQNGVTAPADRDLLLRFLHDLGIVLNFNDPGSPFRLEDTNILNPEWVTGGVYRILTSPRLAEQQGLLNLSDLALLFQGDQRYPESRYPFLVGMMRKFELCFEIPDSKGQQLLVPELLPQNEPDLVWERLDALNFEYHYSILPGGLICRFIVKMQRDLPRRPTVWRTGVVLEIGDNRALVRADSTRLRVLISVQGLPAGRRYALAEIRRALEQIHATLPGLAAQAKVPLYDNPDIVVDYDHLGRLALRNIDHFLPPGSDKEYRVQDLLNSVRDTWDGRALPRATRQESPTTLRLTRVRLKNIRCFEDFQLDLSGRPDGSDWGLLLGENGVGKTTILRAIAIGLCDASAASALVDDLPGSFLRQGETEGWIEIEFAGGSRFRTVLKLADGGIRLSQPDAIPRDRLFVCGYGSARRGFATADHSAYSVKAAVATLFNYDTSLLNPELTFRRLVSRGYSIENIKRRLDALLILPAGSTDIPETGVVVSGPWGKFAPLGVIGDGYQATLAWIADLLGWAFFYNPSFLSNEITGIVLIDELEQHLHPRWQREVIRLLAEQFPRVQFIASSHSPLCALGTTALSEGRCKLALLHRTDDQVTVIESDPPKGQRADQVLTSPLFGLFSASSFDVPADIQKYARLKSLKTPSPEDQAELARLHDHLQKVLGPFENEYERRIEEVVRETVARDLQSAIADQRVSPEVLGLQVREKLRQFFRRSDRP